MRKDLARKISFGICKVSFLQKKDHRKIKLKKLSSTELFEVLLLPHVLNKDVAEVRHELIPSKDSMTSQLNRASQELALSVRQT